MEKPLCGEAPRMLREPPAFPWEDVFAVFPEAEISQIDGSIKVRFKSELRDCWFESRNLPHGLLVLIMSAGGFEQQEKVYRSF